MARISKYRFDQDVTKDDFVIGSDGITKVTRNYKLETLASFFGTQDQILGDKFSYIYNQVAAYADLSAGQISFSNKSVTNTPFSGVETIYINKLNQSGNDVTDYMQAVYDAGGFLQINNAENSTYFGVYRIQAINTVNANVISLTVDVTSSNGTTTSLDNVTLSGVYSGDKTYVHTQLAALSTWTINHTLSKFPSVTIVDDGGNVVIGDVAYISESQLTVTFSGALSGKAYLN